MNSVSGYLRKLKLHIIFFGGTNKRWFELNFDNETLSYKNDKNSNKISHKIKFFDIKKYFEFSNVNKKDCDYKYGFSLSTKDRTFILYTKTEEERKMWNDGFKRMMEINLQNHEYNYNFNKMKKDIHIFQNNNIYEYSNSKCETEPSFFSQQKSNNNKKFESSHTIRKVNIDFLEQKDDSKRRFSVAVGDNNPNQNYYNNGADNNNFYDKNKRKISNNTINNNNYIHNNEISNVPNNVINNGLKKRRKTISFE